MDGTYLVVAGLCLAGLAGIANILYWRHLEEGALESLFGEAYRVYRRATWF